jgi:Protein of unknown function (DUF2934)
MNNHVPANAQEHTRNLAFEYWERRGRPFGSPEIDWSAAEKALATSRGHSEKEFSLCSLQMRPKETSHH